ncbi:MAG: hypothetical protein ACOY94_10525 [Bacillota bacterium]
MHDYFAMESRVRAHQAEVNQFLQQRALLARMAEPQPEPARQAPAATCIPCSACPA